MSKKGFIQFVKDYQEKQRRRAMEDLVIGSVVLTGLTILVGIILTIKTRR